MTDLPRDPRQPYRRPTGQGWDRRPPGSVTSARGPTGPLGLATARHWPRRALIGVNVLVALCLVVAVSAFGYVQWRLNQIHREQLSQLASIGGGKPFTMLIVGSDTRAGLANNSSNNSRFGGGSATPGQRSDTIILARVAPETRQLMLMSIPRDLWVPIPGHGSNRINSAFDTGPNLLIQTIETDLHIPVNHYVEVNFDTFRDIADAVGGVKFYFPTPARDAYSLLNVPQAGCTLLTGNQALGFVRSRHYEYYKNGSWHYEAESDLARVQRQQAFIKKMIKKAEGEFTNPVALNNVIAGVTKNLTVDSGFSNSDLLTLAKDFRSINASGIPSLTLPNYPFTTSGGAEVLGLQEPQAAQTIAAFNSFGNSPPPSAPKTTTPDTVDPASINVVVANGTGTPGQAAQLAHVLSGKGYHATDTTATPGYDHPRTQILDTSSSEKAAKQVDSAVPGGGDLVKVASLSSPYSVEVVSGLSYTNAANGAGSSSTATKSAPTTAPPTTVPGTNASTYTLPGSPPGFVPPANC